MQRDFSRYVDDRPQDGVFRVHKDVYTSPELFELEMKYIFEKTWSFIGHESQLRNTNDWRATHIGRTPVLVMRDERGRIGAFINACRHKGAKLTRTEAGNRKLHVCPYHGWAYRSDGCNANIKNKAEACYTDAFEQDDHGLIPLASVATYKGLVFGSLSADVPPLEDFLGDLRFFLDLALEQGAEGMEVVPGRIEYTYNANWKLQLENGTDAYHLTSTHAGFLDVMARRAAGEGNQDARQFDWRKRFSQTGGDFQFANGHTVIWLEQAEVSKRPIYPVIDSIRERVGATKAEWMLKLRNLSVFPNMQVAENTSLLIRTFRPLAVDRTEMRVWCLAPVGEAPEQRAWRMRQFEDFFNVSGLATPDDTVTYEACQNGMQSVPLHFLQGHARGMAALQPGASERARTLGIHPVASLESGYGIQSEMCFHPLYREWTRLMNRGASQENAHA